MITDKIIGALFDSEIVVSDLTNLNPNVLYETALRHMAERPIILIANDGTDLPFDTSGQATIFYRIDDYQRHVKARENIAAFTKAVLEPGYKVSNPVTQARGSLVLAKSGDSKDQIISEMREQLSKLDAAVKAVIEDSRRPRVALGEVNWDQLVNAPALRARRTASTHPIAVRGRDPTLPWNQFISAPTEADDK